MLNFPTHFVKSTATLASLCKIEEIFRYNVLLRFILYITTLDHLDK